MSIVLFVQVKCGRRRASLEWTLLSPKEEVEVFFSSYLLFLINLLFYIVLSRGVFLDALASLDLKLSVGD